MNRRFTVCTICHNRVLNCLHRVGVDVCKVHVAGRRLVFDVPSRQCAAACNCLRGMCMDYEVRRLGPEALARFLRRRPALWITAAVLSLALILALQVVWAVRIDCPDNLYPAVSQVLSTRHFSPRFRRQVDAAAIRNAVSEVEGVALVSVYTRGVFLHVDVKEELPQRQLVTYDGPIVAECDCIISRIVVERGRALVQVGQTVRRGDVLIAPEYLLDDEADITAPTQAVGCVYGYVYPSYSVQYEEHTFRTVRTGNKTSTAAIRLAGRALGTSAPCPYAQYEAERQFITLDGVLPLQIERTTYYETHTVEEFLPFAVAKEAVLEECYAEIYAQLKKDVEILSKWCIIDNMGSIHRVRAYAQVEQQVGVYRSEA